jgi:hypothetical protein
MRTRTWTGLATGWFALWVIIFARADSYDWPSFIVIVGFPILFIYLIFFVAVPRIARAVKRKSK